MLSDLFQDVIVQEELVVQVLRLGREALFPNDALGQPQPQPSEEEKTAIQKRTEEAILHCIPRKQNPIHVVGVDDNLKNNAFRCRSYKNHLLPFVKAGAAS